MAQIKKNAEGMLSVNSENIFPIIKKWLYTEQDIFIRELISNASDAIEKRKQLNQSESLLTSEGEIFLELDCINQTLKIIDNGLGMDEEEIHKYINQIAFSGATDFIEKYKTNGDQVIGHFGLGFYSAFMAAEHVAIESLSCKSGASAVRWDGTADMHYEMTEITKEAVGTVITLYLPENSKYLNPNQIEMAVKKYFNFFHLPITLTCIQAEDVKEAYGSKVINDTNPLWNRRPENCTREDYISFYKKAFDTEVIPKLWIHLYNEELRVKGIIYFRSEGQFNESIDGHMRLYCKQVYISDQAKTLIPDYLFLQDGIIDYADAPLMVSRSALQEDENVKAVTNYITEQVAYKLYGTFECERTFYESIWEDLNPFMKFSCLKDKLLASYVEKFIIFKNLSGNYVTLKEHLEAIKDDHEKVIYYISDEIQQAYYINAFVQAGVDALYMTHVVDSPFMKKQEMRDQELRFNRIDSDFYQALKSDISDEEEERLNEIKEKLDPIFAEIFAGKAIELSVGKFRSEKISSVMIIDEEERRVRDTLELYETRGIDISGFKAGNDTLMINAENILVKYLMNCDDKENRMLFAHQLYDFARLGQEALEAQEMAAFIERSNQVLRNMVLSQGEAVLF